MLACGRILRQTDIGRVLLARCPHRGIGQPPSFLRSAVKYPDRRMIDEAVNEDSGNAESGICHGFFQMG